MVMRRDLCYHGGMRQPIHRAGTLLREWRRRRKWSQLDLAFEADISPRHLSFLETGRSQPSRAMLLRLAERLDVPLRERNVLLTAAGYAPVFPERSLADPALDAARRAVNLVLAGHEPYPALAIDRHWMLVASNRAIPPLLEGADPALLRPPVNVLRLSLHPDGLARRMLNLPEWRSHLLTRLRQQISATADPFLMELLHEIGGYPAPGQAATGPSAWEEGGGEEYGGIVVPLRIVTKLGTLALFSTTTVFGTPRDVTLSEIALESFFPADAASAAALHGRED